MIVFLSYRRSDSGDFVDYLEERLRGRMMGAQVFRDVRGIEPGDRWKEKIAEKIDLSQAVLVVIGPTWLTTQKAGEPRLFRADDVVRFEVARALEKGSPIVPILIDGATFPEREQLPRDIRDLDGSHAHTVRPDAVEEDVRRLVKRLGLMLETKIQEEPQDESRARAGELIDEMERMMAADPKGENLDAYWRWFQDARGPLQSMASGTEVEAHLKHIEEHLRDARSGDSISVELSLLEVSETLRAIRALFSTTAQREQDDTESQANSPGGAFILPGVKTFSFAGRWQCQVSGQGQEVMFELDAAEDGTVTGTVHAQGGSRRIDGRHKQLIWSPEDGHRYVGGPPLRCVGVQLSCLLDGKDRFEFSIPVMEKFGAGYSGRDREGTTYFLRPR